MSKLSAARGTQDILPPTSKLWQEIEAVCMTVFNAAGYAEIRTPIFEPTELFARAVGESSDIVNKEMYTFSDRSDRSLTLRPEATAAIVRAYIEHNLDKGPRPYKAWYRGPMFRYERPQAGRYRQFHQIGIEALGSSSIHLDLELLSLGLEVLQRLGLTDLSLHINSLGTSESRTKYREALLKFLSGIESEVCEDCKRRMAQNPLRVLDCKVPADQALYVKAPVLQDYYDEESQKIWQEILKGTEKLQQKYQTKILIDPKLVRGLDYYNHLVFEVKTSVGEHNAVRGLSEQAQASLGQQNTVLAGGRYDSLVSTLGGPETPAAGWALGIERLALLIEGQGTRTQAETAFYIVSDDTAAAAALARDLRAVVLPLDIASPIRVEYDYENAKVGKQIEKAAKRGADYVVFYLADERNSGKFKIKNLKDSSEFILSTIEEIADLGSKPINERISS